MKRTHSLKNNLQKWTQDKTGNMHSPVFTQEIEVVIKSSHKELPSPPGFSSEF